MRRRVYQNRGGGQFDPPGCGRVVAAIMRPGVRLLRRGSLRSKEEVLMPESMPTEGSRAPAFSLTAHDGSTVALSQFASKKHVVLFFYPRADTPG